MSPSTATAQAASTPMLVVVSLMRPQGTTGVQTHVRQFVEHLRATGQAVQLITPFSAPLPLVAGLIALRRLLERVSPTAAVGLYRRGHAWLLGLALRPALRRLGPCAVYAQCPVSAEVALRVRRPAEQRVTMVVHFNQSQAEEWADKGAVQRGGSLYRRMLAFEQRVLPGLDAIVFLAQRMRAELQARMPSLRDVPAAVIPNFVLDTAGASAAPGSSTGPMRDLLAIGTLEPRKNQAYLLEVLAALRDRGIRPTLTIVGDGPDRAALTAHVRALRLGQQVHFAGFVPNAAALFASHRACIHLARMENLPLTLIEALAWGRPVFATAVGGIPELMQDGAQGRFLPLDDAASASALLAAAWQDPVTWRSWGLAARQRFVTTYRREEVADRLLHFLRTGAAREVRS